MKRPVCTTTLTRYSAPRSAAGYTMVEILVATALMLTIMLAVAWVFGMVGETIADSRSTLEMTGQLRSVAARLKQELDGVTVTPSPPIDPAENEGYLEITEGAIGPVIGYVVGRNIERNEVDTTVGDFDDMISFTTRSNGTPFVGQMVKRVDPTVAPYIGLPVIGQDDWQNDGTPDDDYAYVAGAIESDVAEVAYFVRGGTLYRRQLLVLPNFPQADLDERNPGFQTLAEMFYAKWGFYNNDVSIRQEWFCTDTTSSPPLWGQVMAANTLGDLTKPENRFAHRTTVPSGPSAGQAAGFPYHPHWWYDWDASPTQPRQTRWATVGSSPGLGLPTLEECSHPSWEAAGLVGSPTLTASGGGYDAWSNPHSYNQLDKITGSLLAFSGNRIGEDVVLTNVVGFDVKVWDPQAWVLPAIDAKGTSTDLSAASYWTSANFWNGNLVTPDDDVIPGVAVVPGDPGYALALAHAIDAMQTDPPDPALDRFRPVGYGAYVDLNYMYRYMYVYGSPSAVYPINGSRGYTAADLRKELGILTPFAGQGEPRSGLRRVYDTGSTHYESNWLDSNLNGEKDAVVGIEDLGNEDRDVDSSGDPLIDEGSDGMDNNSNGMVDDALEEEGPVPYPEPLRGIQIKIRVFDTDSRQVRERTIICDFLPK